MSSLFKPGDLCVVYFGDGPAVCRFVEEIGTLLGTRESLAIVKPCESYQAGGNMICGMRQIKPHATTSLLAKFGLGGRDSNAD